LIMKCKFFLLLILVSLIGCNSNDGSYPVSSTVSGTQTGKYLFETSRGSVSECPSGTGLIIQGGLSTTGTLQASDITSTTYVCDGASIVGAQGTQGIAGTSGEGAGIQVIQATATQCPNGGIQVTTFIDANNAGIYQSNDTKTSINTICNGSNGENGESFQVTQTSATLAQCSNGGVQVTTLNISSNGNIVATNNSVLCNGQNGTPGQPGINGIGIVFTTLSATSTQCPTGGSVLIVASDTLGTGIYSVNDSNQKNIVTCNEQIGSTGKSSLITTIAPCTNKSQPVGKEQLLCLSDGNILSDFSDTMAGANTRLSFIPLNLMLEDTDDSNCLFTATQDLKGNTTITWYAGTNQWGSWNSGSVTCEAQ
jgi:hypothetical protein